MEIPAPIADNDSLAAMLGELGHEVEVQRHGVGEATCLISLDAGASRHVVEVELSPGGSRAWLVAQLGVADIRQSASGPLAQLLTENVRIGPSFFGFRGRDSRLLLHAGAENRDMTPSRLDGHLDRLRKLIRDTRPIWSTIIRPAAQPASVTGITATPPANADDEKTWCMFTSPEGHFRVQLPELPRVDRHTLATEKGPVDLHVVSADQTGVGVSYGVCYSDLEGPGVADGRDGAAEVLARAREAMVKLLEGQVLEERPITLQGYPGLELTVHSQDKGMAVARVFCVGDRFFQVLAVGKDANVLQQPVRSFLDSFRLVRE
jgi:hypothetical protein